MKNDEKKKVRIITFGYNGENNTGSEAKLLTTITDLKETIGDRIGEITCMTLTEELQRRYITDSNIKIMEIGSPKSIVVGPLKNILGKPRDIIMLSEGSTFIDHFGSLFMWMFCLTALFGKLRGEKVVAYANDCGHLKPINQRLLRWTLNKVDLIMLRNPDAAARMKEFGVTKEIHVTADGAYQYPLPPKDYRDAVFKKLNLDPEKKPVIGIAPKEFFWWPIKYKPYGRKEDLYRIVFYHTWPKGGREWGKRYIEDSARYADYCVETYGANIALIAMERMDYPPAKQIYDAMKHKDEARIVASNDYIVDDIISVLSGLKFQVTTRYHTTVLGSCSAIPMIAISSDTRCEAVFRELGMMDLYIDYVEHAHPVPPHVENLYQTLVEKTEMLVSKEKELRDRIAKGHEMFLKRCMQNRVIFKKWFDENF